MGVEVLIASAVLATTAVSASEQKKEAKRARAAQENIRNEERARNKAQEMSEKRKQIREERIQRARILQASQNTGTAYSSGEAGALSSLNTQLGSNLGSNASMVRSGERISIFAQQASDAQSRQQSAATFGQFVSSALPLAGSIFRGTLPGTTPQDQNIESYYGAIK